MGTNFTPGPWECGDYGGDYDGQRFGEVAYLLSKEGCSFDATEANARLIVAAPCLYEAGENALKALGNMTAPQHIIDALNALGSALAKARGECR